MKFTDYQNVEDGVKTYLTDKQKASKFWNRGKWDNYIAPHITEKVDGMTYIDMGCNAGLFLKYAEDKGFNKVIGIDINPDVVKRGIAYRKRVGGKWDIRVGKMEEALNDLPVADYMTFSNSHNYILLQHWLDMLDILYKKTRYCIITATRKKPYFCMASNLEGMIQRYFRNWNLVSRISQLPMEDDPCPRSLNSLCFKSPALKRISLDILICTNHLRHYLDNFYEELEKGAPPLETCFYKSLRKKKRRATDEELQRWIFDKVATYEDVKKNGIKEPIIVDNNTNKILDGNYRIKMLRVLGYKTTIVRGI